MVAAIPIGIFVMGSAHIAAGPLSFRGFIHPLFIARDPPVTFEVGLITLFSSHGAGGAANTIWGLILVSVLGFVGVVGVFHRRQSET